MLKRFCLFSFLFFFVLTVVWGVFLAHRFDLLPQDYHLSLELVSLDNFYDAQSGKYIGEEESVSSFIYDTVDSNLETSYLKNHFSVLTLEGDSIIDINRSLVVDRKELEVLNDSEAEVSYLFAPRWLEEGDSFYYSHVNYDVPVRMNFVETDVIEGLEVFKYFASFQVDQTDKLGHLPNVPDQRGVNLDVDLTVYIEPVTGLMVSYSDSATAYYYSKKTGVRIEPWNTFSNTVKESSLQENIASISAYKIWSYFFRYTVLICLLLLALMFFVLYISNNIKLDLIYIGITFSLIIVVSTYTFWSQIFPKESVASTQNEYRIGIATWIKNENILEGIDGFKTIIKASPLYEQKNVVFIEAPTYSNDQTKTESAITEMLDKDLDLVFSVTTNATLYVLENLPDPSTPVVFSGLIYPAETGVYDNRLRVTGNRIWVSPFDQVDSAQRVLGDIKSIGFIHKRGEETSDIQFQEFRSELKTRFDIDVIEINVQTTADISRSVEFYSEKVDLFYSACDTFVLGGASSFIHKEIMNTRKPELSCLVQGVEDGALIAVSANMKRLGAISAEQALEIMNGKHARTIPLRTDPYPKIYINTKTANRIGVSIPQSVRLDSNVVFIE